MKHSHGAYMPPDYRVARCTPVKKFCLTWGWHSRHAAKRTQMLNSRYCGAAACIQASNPVDAHNEAPSHPSRRALQYCTNSC